MPNQDYAGKDYWHTAWERRAQRALVDWTNPSILNQSRLWYDEFFQKHFEGLPPGTRIVEVGAGDSVWLPYFAHRFGFDVTGIDYSELGCQRARANLKLAGIAADVAKIDVFRLPASYRGRFDVVYSMGLIEHFSEPEKLVEACAELLCEGGIMITNLPNMCGSLGTIQRLLDPRVYEAHNPLDKKDVSDAHRAAGLHVIECQYFMPINFAVVSVDMNKSNIRFAWAASVYWLMCGLTLGVWMMQRLLRLPLPVTRRWSPIINCVAWKG